MIIIRASLLTHTHAHIYAHIGGDFRQRSHIPASKINRLFERNLYLSFPLYIITSNLRARVGCQGISGRRSVRIATHSTYFSVFSAFLRGLLNLYSVSLSTQQKESGNNKFSGIYLLTNLICINDGLKVNNVFLIITLSPCLLYYPYRVHTQLSQLIPDCYYRMDLQKHYLYRFHIVF